MLFKYISKIRPWDGSILCGARKGSVLRLLPPIYLMLGANASQELQLASLVEVDLRQGRTPGREWFTDPISCPQEEMSLDPWTQGSWGPSMSFVEQAGIQTNLSTFLSLVRLCENTKALSKGRCVHDCIIQSGFEGSMHLESLLVQMYGKCESLEDALALFAKTKRDTFLWNFIIKIHVQEGESQQALQLFEAMQEEHATSDKFTFVLVLSACASQAASMEGKQVHAFICDKGLELDTLVGTALVSMYGKCGSLKEACHMFKSMPIRNTVSWTALIAMHAQHGKGMEALQFFDQMLKAGMKPNKVTFVCALDACAGMAVVSEGKQMHGCILYNAYELDVAVGNALINMYGKCCHAEDASRCFTKMPIRDVISWTSMITVQARHGKARDALQLLDQMQHEGVKPNKVTFLCILEACTRCAELFEGEIMYQLIMTSGLELDINVETALVNMYVKCGNLQDSRKIFGKLQRRDVIVWTSMIAGYAQNGVLKEAGQLFIQMQEESVLPNTVTFVCFFDACSSCAALAVGQRMHACITDNICKTDLSVGNALVNMYSKCGNLEGAETVFFQMKNQDAVSFNALMAVYLHCRQKKGALQLFEQMQNEGVMPDKFTVVYALSACASQAAYGKGKQIQVIIQCNAFEWDVVVATALLNMYGKCGSLKDAECVFHKMPERNVVSWTTMMTAYIQHEQVEKAIQLFENMLLEGIMPNKVTFLCALDACASLSELCEGKWMHAYIVEIGFELDVVLGNAIINMYGKCGTFEDAQRMFDSNIMRDVVSWTAMIAAYAQNGRTNSAFQLFDQMQKVGVRPNKVTFVCILEACNCCAALTKGKQLHSFICDSEIELDIDVGTALVNMYGECGSLNDAQHTFKNLPEHDKVSWNAMIKVCAWHGQVKEALKYFSHMEWCGMSANEVTCLSMIDVFANCEALAKGKQFHAFVVEKGLEIDIAVGNALLNMYGKFSSVQDVWIIFVTMPQRDVVSWNTMISFYAQNGQVNEVLHLFLQMKREAVMPDRVTYVNILDACASSTTFAEHEQICHWILNGDFQSDAIVETALLNMYGKCGYVETARKVFDQIQEKNVISWTAMISVYAQQGQCLEALHMFDQMQGGGVLANSVTFVCLLDACASCALLTEGRQIDICIMNSGYDLDPTVGTALLNMYGKCGSLDDVCKIFDKLPERNLVLWSAMIAGHARHGLGKLTLQLYDQMQTEGVEPDNVTFLSVLTACSHTGLVSEGCIYFASMIQDYGISPTTDHYVCMIDLLGRAGRLDEAENLINYIPVQPNLASFMALLGACRYQGDVQQGNRIAKHVFELGELDITLNILLSHIYAAAGQHDEAAKSTFGVSLGYFHNQTGFCSSEDTRYAHDLFVDD